MNYKKLENKTIENNIIRKYCFSHNQQISNSGVDSGNIYLSGGFNTFVINNYIGSIIQHNANAVNSHLIHNTFGALLGVYNPTEKKFYEIRSKIYSHIYNNVVGYNNFNNIDNGQNGKNYYHYNFYDSQVGWLSWIDSMFKGNI